MWAAGAFGLQILYSSNQVIKATWTRPAVHRPNFVRRGLGTFASLQQILAPSRPPRASRWLLGLVYSRHYLNCWCWWPVEWEERETELRGSPKLRVVR